MEISSTFPFSAAGAGVQQHGHSDETASSTRPGELTPEEEQKVRELKKIDAEVRRHEAAHKAAAGQFASGGPTFELETGPDGRKYAVGGEVKIDTSKVPGDPEATIKKAQVIQRAALAPKEPSGQDRKVAAQAQQLELEARQELAQQKKEQTQTYGSDGRTAQSTANASIVDLIV